MISLMQTQALGIVKSPHVDQFKTAPLFDVNGPRFRIRTPSTSKDDKTLTKTDVNSSAQHLTLGGRLIII